MADEEEPKVNLQRDGSKVDSDENDDFGSSVDGSASFAHNNKMMDIDSPSSELENLTGDISESDNDSIKSGKNGIYEVNPDKTETENKENRSVSNNENSNENSDTNAGSETSEPMEKKAKTNRRMTDSFTSQKSSGRSSPRLNQSLPDSRPASAASSSKSGTKDEKDSTPSVYMIWSGRGLDPAKREKEREKEEQIRLRQIRLAEERQRKIEEMKEQQRMAQEKREKQLELRRKKIEESKRKDAERRKEVEERRMQQELIDKAKKEAMLSKAKERLTRYEQWKSHGRKGGYPFGFSPPSKSLSMSTSVLYQKSSPQFSSTGTLNTTASGGLKSGAESMIASAPPTRHKSSVNLGSSFSGVKMRDPNKMSPRKPRPSSVATSMPSFVKIDMADSPKSSRSKSTDRTTREHSKTRVPGHKEDKSDGQEKRAATLPRPYDRKKIEERRQEIKRKTEERKEREIEKQERMTKSDYQEDKKDKAQVRMSRSFIERMSVPKRPSPDKKEPAVKESSGVKVVKKAGVVEAPKASLQKAKASPKEKPKVLPDSPSKSALKSSLRDTKAKDDSSSTRSESPKSLSPAPSGTPPARGTPTIQGEEENRGLDETDSPDISFDESSKELSGHQPTVTFAEPEAISSPRHKPAEVKQASPEPKAKPETKSAPAAEAKPKTDKEREMEEYKAKLAEKRRLAREKAEREAEIERLRQEEEQRKEEERERLEEERQRAEEEEAMRIAEESRKAEEERLQKAIEAEERRKKEEAERLEQERIAKEEADKKAKEEAERLEKERQERAKREEEERVERKKRLEMIMKRVKTGDTPNTTPEKRTESPTQQLMATGSSSRTSLVSSEDERGDDSEKDEGSDGGNKPEQDGQKFKSRLLQQLTETKQNGDSGSGTPKFKSPLLQSIMGKTKLGARLSGSKLNEMGKSEENLSKSDDEALAKSDDNLSETETDKAEVESEQILITVDTTSEEKEDSVVEDKESLAVEEKESSVVEEKEASVSDNKEASNDNNGMQVSSIDACETEESLLTEESRVDVDSHEVSGETVIDTVDKQSVSDQGVTDSLMTQTVSSTADSAVSLSFNGVSSHNGDVHIEPRELIDSKELVDSSISMRTADSFGSSQTGSMGGSLVDSQTVPASDSSQFEEIIDLNVTNKTLKTQQFTDNLLNHSEDLLNLNNIPVGSLDNNHMTAGGDADSHPVGKPFIAFEDNATRRQDVTDLLS